MMAAAMATAMTAPAASAPASSLNFRLRSWRPNLGNSIFAIVFLMLEFFIGYGHQPAAGSLLVLRLYLNRWISKHCGWSEA
jgi:hypothetical protein